MEYSEDWDNLLKECSEEAEKTEQEELMTISGINLIPYLEDESLISSIAPLANEYLEKMAKRIAKNGLDVNSPEVEVMTKIALNAFLQGIIIGTVVQIKASCDDDLNNLTIQNV